jgi:hypothetical protein
MGWSQWALVVLPYLLCIMMDTALTSRHFSPTYHTHPSYRLFAFPFAMFKTKGKAILTQTGEVALALLKLVAASSDWNPPLKAAVGSALHIIGLIKVCIHVHIFVPSRTIHLLIKDFRSRREDWRTFSNYVQGSMAWIIQTLPDASDSREDLRQNLENLGM